MRKCIRCGAEMMEDKPIRLSGSAEGVVIMDSAKFFADSVGRPKAAVCPECGEVSLYIPMEEMEKYKKRKMK